MHLVYEARALLWWMLETLSALYCSQRTGRVQEQPELNAHHYVVASHDVMVVNTSRRWNTEITHRRQSSAVEPWKRLGPDLLEQRRDARCNDRLVCHLEHLSPGEDIG